MFVEISIQHVVLLNLTSSVIH